MTTAGQEVPKAAGIGKTVVVDASVAIAWVLINQATSLSDELFRAGYANRSEIWVPAHWAIECNSTMLKLARADQLLWTDLDAQTNVLFYARPAVDAPPTAQVLRQITELARRYKLSAYDAAYLELAIRKRADLATRDVALRQAAGRAGVDCLVSI